MSKEEKYPCEDCHYCVYNFCALFEIDVNPKEIKDCGDLKKRKE